MEQKFNTKQNKALTPKVEPEAYFVLNDISKKLSVRELITEEESELLKTAYLELQDSGGDRTIAEMEQVLSLGVLTRDQATAIVNHFFIEQTLGSPEGKMVEAYFFAQNLTSTEFITMIKKVSIPEHTKALIQNAYCTIKETPTSKPLL